MKILHISDLHIGKKVKEFSMLEDQEYILKQILEIAEQENVDGVILAGDLYDKPVPSVDAVRMLDQFLTYLADQGILVFGISGNHDSAERLSFGAQLMRSRGIYLESVYHGKTEKICFEDAFGTVNLYLLPFLKPAVVRHALKRDDIGSYQDAVCAALEQIDLNLSERNILVAHQFVTGAKTCESEELAIGGLDQIDSTLFDAFDYVALGHIHSPQKIGRETVRYCGTPLKYSFSEVSQQKSVTVVTLEEKGTVQIEKRPLIPLRDMRKIKGSYLQVTEREFCKNQNTQDYVQITLTDENDVVDGMQKLRIIYPNLMELLYDNRRSREDQTIDAADAIEEKTELELFEEFFEKQNNQMMGEQQRKFVEQMLQDLKEGDVR